MDLGWDIVPSFQGCFNNRQETKAWGKSILFSLRLCWLQELALVLGSWDRSQIECLSAMLEGKAGAVETLFAYLVQYAVCCALLRRWVYLAGGVREILGGNVS